MSVEMSRKLFLGGFILICLIVVGKIIWDRGTRRAIPGIPEPVQEEEVGSIEKEIDDYKVNISYNYSYDIKALVVHTENYSGFGIGDKLSPKDLALAWGDVAEYNDRVDFHWKQSGRWYYWNVNPNDEDVGYVGEMSDISMESSNNHMVPADEMVKKDIKKIRRGDYVRIKGYLAHITAENSKGETFYWDSSETREDTGDGSCELIYVTDVEWLN